MPALYSVTTPAGVIFPILLPPISVNQRLPSGPAAIHGGPLPAVMPALYSVIVGAAAPAADASSAIPSETRHQPAKTRPHGTLLHSYGNRTGHSAGRGVAVA